MRPLALLLLLALIANFAHAAEPSPTPAWPLWDGQESVEQYAKRAGLEPTKALDLGDGVKLEMVLIPAGKFTMGTEEPLPVDEDGFRKKIVTGKAVFAVGLGALLVLLGTVVIRAIRKRQRFQYSLARFMVITVVAGVALLGGLHWHFSAKGLADAKTEYEAAMARFKDSYDWEKPAHEVTISKPYYLGKFEVTQGQYQQVMGVNPSAFKGRDLPVEQVSWDEAQEFCKKASERTGHAIRLPTDAEWEHACRAGTKTAYYTGDSDADLDRAGWYDKNSGNTTHPVGQKVPNAWGTYDMHGNVWEWCQDFYEPYKAGAATDPQGPSQGQYRVLRGGSWVFIPWLCRSASRNWLTPDNRGYHFGFRVAACASRTP
jgi:formylglycine-generating enzyme required for sulfatase activity